MKIYVIDASVAVKWVLQEIQQIEARRYLEKSLERIAPDFILVECLSGIQSKVRNDELSEEEGWESFEMILAYEYLNLVPSRVLLKRAYQLAIELPHSVYDCLYLSLAESLESTVVTADRKFHDRVKSSPYSEFITWVENPPQAS